MHSISKITSRYWYRSRLFWLLFVISSYALVGFLVLPGVIKNIAIEQIEQNLGWQSSIEKVELNPFALTLTVSKLAITDNQGDTVISFDRYHNDIELRSVIEGAATFSSMDLVGPYIRLEIDKAGKSNFQNAFEQTQAGKTPEVETKTESKNSSGAPKLLFDSIKVNAGMIEVIDHSQSELVEHQLKPISFALTNFSTFANTDGSYQLDIALGTGQHLAWKGNIGIAPFHSSGFLKVENIRADRLWVYAQEHAPYTLTHGLVGVEGQYEVSLAENNTLLDISNAIVTLDELQLAPHSTTDTFLDIGSISVGPLDFNLAKQKLDISRLAIDALSLKLERDAQGALTLLAPFSQSTETASEEAPTDVTTNEVATNEVATDEKSSQPFQWSIGELQLNNSQINITDLQPKQPAEIAINKINSRISGLNQDLTQSLDFNLSYFVQNSGKSEISGQVIPTPLNLKAAINLDNLALATIQPYLNEHVRITIEEGSLSVNGDLSLSSTADNETVNGGFTGAINVNQFNSTDQSVNERLVGWQDLTIEPIKVNFNPLSIDISDIRFEEPYGRIIVTEDRSTNLAQLVINAEQKTPQQATSEAPSKPTSEKSQPLPLKIDRILFNNGAAYFADLSLKPQFGTSIQNISGEVSGLSSDNLERASVDIKGTVEDYGKALVKGKINPLSGDLYTDLAVKFDNIELSTMTPYSGRYAGYAIDKGKLNLHLNYKIANRMLDGENRLILDQFELGRSIDSEESVSLPLELALAILKDRNGVIDIDLPTKGNMDDPDFKISGIVLNAFVNVITKAATAPFSMISNLVGGDADALSSVAFEPGNASLSAEQSTNLTKLSEALKSRPQIILEVRASVDRQSDGEALKRIKLDNRFPSNSNLQQRTQILEKLITERAGKPELEKIKTSVSAPSETPEAEIAAVYEKALYGVALKSEPVSSLELTTLAKQRISSIKTQLIEQSGVANEQVFALQPSLDGQLEEGQVITSFNLTTR